MRCPRCETAIDADAVRCACCGAPLQFADEPSPARLDVDLQLDRRRRTATPVPASVTADQASRGEHDLGDLSFDPPADDAWTFGDPKATLAEAAADPAEDAEAEAPVAAELGADAAAGDPADLRVAPADAVATDEDSDDEDDQDDEDESDESDDADEVPRGPEPTADQPAVRRGRVLSLASIAIAAAVLVVALLTSR